MSEVTLPYKFTPRFYQMDSWNTVMKPDFQRGIEIIPRRNGKDLKCWNLLIAKAMQRRALYFYMGPFYNQIRQIIWQGTDNTGRRFLDYVPPQILASRPTKIDMRIELINGSQIKLQGSDNIDSIVGTNPYGIVFTEFSLHKPEAWNLLRPILAENGGWAYFNGTPRGLNHFYELSEKAKANPKEWFHQHMSCEDTGVPTLEAIEKERRDGMPESLIQQEFYCKWTASSEETLIPLDAVDPCLSTKLRPQDYNFERKIIGVDPAFAIKGDQAVIAKRQGRLLHPLQKFRGMEPMSLASRVANDINSWKPDKVMVDAGRGEAVISRLRQLGFGHLVVPVHFSGKPYSELYLNKRAEIWCKMRDWVVAENKPLIPYDEGLIKSMTTPIFWHNDRGFIQIEGKKHIMQRLKFSPDEGDAVAVTFGESLPMEIIQPNRAGLSIAERALLDMHTVEKPYDALEYLDTEDVLNLEYQTG